MEELRQIVQRFPTPKDALEFSTTDLIEDSEAITVVRVDASQEGGTKTDIKLLSGQRVVFFARGLITYDGGHPFATPDGILCNEYGIPLSFREEGGSSGIAVCPHPDAYTTDGGETGRIESLVGWIGDNNEQSAILVGSKREIQADKTGYLYLTVNDARGTYGDNDGEFRVDIKIVK